MHNKVVTTVVRVLRDLNIPILRFNFRGVGNSQGTFDNGIGESEDCIQLIQEWNSKFNSNQLILIGFSFGSYVMYRVATKLLYKLLISIAPPVTHYDYAEFTRLRNCHIIQGDIDNIVNYDSVSTFVKQSSSPIIMHTLTNAEHFFHGKLLELRAVLIEIMAEYLDC